MQTLEEFKKWYFDNHYDEEDIDYLVSEYLSDFNYPYAPNGYVKIGGKDIPIGDVSATVDDWFEGNYLEESDLVNECCNWMIEHIKSIDENEVLKQVKLKKVRAKKIALQKDFK